MATYKPTPPNQIEPLPLSLGETVFGTKPYGPKPKRRSPFRRLKPKWPRRRRPRPT
jgi:hypothetical protein